MFTVLRLTNPDANLKIMHQMYNDQEIPRSQTIYIQPLVPTEETQNNNVQIIITCLTIWPPEDHHLMSHDMHRFLKR